MHEKIWNNCLFNVCFQTSTRVNEKKGFRWFMHQLEPIPWCTIFFIYFSLSISGLVIHFVKFFIFLLEGQWRPNPLALRCCAWKGRYCWISCEAKCRQRYEGCWWQLSRRHVWVGLALVATCRQSWLTYGLFWVCFQLNLFLTMHHQLPSG